MILYPGITSSLVTPTLRCLAIFYLSFAKISPSVLELFSGYQKLTNGHNSVKNAVTLAGGVMELNLSTSFDDASYRIKGLGSIRGYFGLNILGKLNTFV